MNKYVVAHIQDATGYSKGMVIGKDAENAILDLLKDYIQYKTRYLASNVDIQILTYVLMTQTTAIVTLEGTANDYIQAEISIIDYSEDNYGKFFNLKVTAANKFEVLGTISLHMKDYIDGLKETAVDDVTESLWHYACMQVGLRNAELSENPEVSLGTIWQIGINPPVEQAEVMEKICYALGSPSTEEIEAVDEQGYVWMITLPKELEERMREDESLKEVVTYDGVTYTIICEEQ
jgi:hypothetical protein